MHPVLSSYLGQFSSEHSILDLSEADRFERFVNYAILTNRCSVRFDIEDVTTEPPEVGIDGVAIIVGDEVVTTASDAELLFERRSRDLPVVYIFIQAKRSESFNRRELLNLGSAVRDVISENPALPADSRLLEASLIHRTVVNNMTKVRDGQPICQLYYASTGRWSNDPILESTAGQVEHDLMATRYFRDVRCEFVDFDRLRQEWIATRSPTEARFSVIRELPIPGMASVPEALLLVVSASAFVDNVLTDPRGKLRANIFEQNVRHFLSEDNEVNAQIRSTIGSADKKARFAILNNGITIVADQVRRQGNNVSIKNYQIVNGCQTSHVLFLERPSLDETVSLVVKAISTSDSRVVDELVVATNSQTKVADSQFLAMQPELRSIQDFFASFPGDDNDDRRLYFERRLGEFSGRDIAAVRVFDIHSLAKVFAAMFLDAPHDALGSPRRIYDLPDLFRRPGIEVAYYTAAFAYYRLVLMLGNRQIDRGFGVLKWHVLTALRYQNIGPITLSAKPARIQAACEKLLRGIWSAPRESLSLYEKAVSALSEVPLQDQKDYRSKMFTDRLISALSRKAKPKAKTKQVAKAKRKSQAKKTGKKGSRSSRSR